MGKSTLLRRLPRSTDQSVARLIYIDCNLLDDTTPAAFFALLRASLPGSPDGSQSMVAAIARALETAPRLVLLFDEWDRLARAMPDTFFLQLRALYDTFAPRLSYCVATNIPLLACGRDDEEGIAEFYELFADARTLRLRGLSLAEIAALTEYLPTPPDVAALHTLAGGHPVLTRLALDIWQRDPSISLTEWEQRMMLDDAVRREGGRIWVGLPQSEQHELVALLGGVQHDSPDGAMGSLVARGLACDAADGRRIFAQLFARYIGGITPAPEHITPACWRVAYDPRRDVVVLGDPPRHLPLTGNAARLFRYLYERQSETCCTKDELITYIWGTGGYSTENLDKLTSDLRALIGDTDKRSIRTIPRRGVQMVGVEMWHSG